MAEVPVVIGSIEGLTILAIVDDQNNSITRIEVTGTGRVPVRFTVTGQFSFSRDVEVVGGQTYNLPGNRYKIRTTEPSWSPIPGYSVEFMSL